MSRGVTYERKPMLPWRRPWWALVLVAMIGFGYVQEDTKVKLNH